MKFPFFREFRAGNGIDIAHVAQYLSFELNAVIKELAAGLSRLTFAENFHSFEVDVEIAAGSELEIRNELRGGVIPSYRIIVRGSDDSQNIVDGDTVWNKDYVYLKNVGASSATAKVIFFR